MEPQWYYTLAGQQCGPVPGSQLRSLLQGGQVPNNEFVFKEGMADWVVASSCAELTGQAPGGPPAPPAQALVAPRVGVGQLEFGEVYKEAFEVFKAQWLHLCLGVLVMVAPNMVLGLVAKALPERWVALMDFASVVVTAPLVLGLWIVFLNAVDRREVHINQIWDGFGNFVPALIVNVARHVMLFPGWVFSIALPSLGVVLMLLGIIPFFAVLFFLVFAFGYLADRKCPPIEAIKLSFVCVKDNILLVLVLSVMAIPLMIAGFLAALVGLIPAGAFWLLTLAVAYRWLNPQTPAA